MPHPDFALDGDGPLFRQIGRAVTQQILKGRYKQGERLPSEAELTAVFATSRQTVNKAISELAKDGLVSRNRRAGTIVSWQFQERFAIPLRDVSDEAGERHQLYQFRVLERRVAPNGRHGLAWSALPDGRPLLYVEVLHLADGLPVQLECRTISIDACPQVEHEAFTDTAPSKWLLNHVPWSEVDHAVRATNATADLAHKLGIEVGGACLVVDRQTFHRGRPITFVHMTYPGTRFALHGRSALNSGRG
jgi:GntR family histidine utilization transcriptional repressor